MKHLYRSKQNRMIAGVCGGLGEFVGIDPTVVRFLSVLFGIMTGIIPFVLVYLIAIVVIPEDPNQTASTTQAPPSV